MTERTYSLALKGEQHNYSVDAWMELDADQICLILSDLTGYKAGYLRHELPKRFDRLGYAIVEPAHSAGWGSPPRFLVRSSDGRAMEEPS